jgi:dipeptidyl aminopeptidase/acylaminoacyl peptidase
MDFMTGSCQRVHTFSAGMMLLAALWPAPSLCAADDPLRPPAIEATDVPAIPPALAERLRQYQAVRSAAFRGWSPDGKGILAATRFGDTTQLHRVYEPGGRREQITFFDEPADGGFIPEARDGAMLVLMSQGGSENNQVYFLDRGTGRATLLTDGKSRNLLGPLTHDGAKMIVHSNQRNGRDTDLYLGDPRKAGSLKLLMEVENEHWSARDWSRDGTRLLINRYVSINETYPALLDVATAKKTPIPIPGGKASYGSLRFSHDGKSAYVSSDAHSEFQELARIDLSDFKYTWLTPDIPWDVDSIEISQKTGAVAFTVNEDGASALYLLNGDKPERVELPLGQVGSLEFSPNGKHLGLTISRPDAPADAYSLELANRKLTRWTYSEVGGLNPETFVTAKRIQFESFDGRRIPAYYFSPKVASPQNRVPVIINIHGGPEGQYRPYFSGVEQFYLNELGYAVIHPNVRGSDGYGKTYLQLDNAEKREDSVRDIGGLLDWIARQPELDQGGGRYRGHRQFSHVSEEHQPLPAGPAPGRIRRRTRSEDAGSVPADRPVEQHRQDPFAADGDPRAQRSPGAVLGSRTDRRPRPRRRPPGLDGVCRQ